MRNNHLSSLRVHVQVPSVTGPWLTSVYRQDAVSQVASLTPPIYAPTLPAHQVTRTQILGSGAFSTVNHFHIIQLFKIIFDLLVSYIF